MKINSQKHNCMHVDLFTAGEKVKGLINDDELVTLKQVLDSGLTWGMVLYGEEEEEMMQKSTDPVIKRIWDEKIVEEYAPTPKVLFLLDSAYRAVLQ